MAENYTPQYVQTFTNDTSAVNTVNNNFTAISAAFQDVLSRTGVQPNSFGSTLDMNGNQILNLPFPTTLNSPARLADVTNAQNISIVTATTGTAGHSVPFLDGTNTWAAPQTFNTTTSSLTQALVTNNTFGGSASGTSVSANQINVTDSAQVGGFFSSALSVFQTFGGSSLTGGREVVNAVGFLTAPTSGSNTNRNYVASVGNMIAQTGDGGSGVTQGTSLGAIFGGNFVAQASTSACTNLFNVSACEFNTSMVAGSSCYAKSLIQLSGSGSDLVAGSGVNTMMWLYNQTSSSAKWTNALLIDNENGGGSFPISATGTLIKATGGTVNCLIDFSNMIVQTGQQAVLLPGLDIAYNGQITTGASGFSNGFIQFVGTSGGATQVSVGSAGNLLTISNPIQVGNIGSAGTGQINIAGGTSGSCQLACTATGGGLLMGGGNTLISSSGQISTSGSFISIADITASPSGGASGTGVFLGSANVGIYFGTGNPTVSAAKGSIYLENGSGQLWINQSGTTTWTQITVP